MLREQVMDYLHERGVKGYVAMNILLFDEELERAENTIRVIAASNADAVIVQVCHSLCGPARVACSPSLHNPPALHHRHGWHWPCMNTVQGLMQLRCAGYWRCRACETRGPLTAHPCKHPDVHHIRRRR